MKKFLLSLILLVGISGTYSFASDCMDVEFDNGSVCVNIENVSSKTFKLTTDVSEGNGVLRCGIYLKSEKYNEVKNYPKIDCNGGTFTVPGLDIESVKIFIKQGSEVPSDWEDKPGKGSQRLFPQWYYDFDNEEWTDGEAYNSSDSNLDNLYITANTTYPDINERVDITVEARDDSDDKITDYEGDVDFTVYYRKSSSSAWTKAPSSYYEIDDDSYSFDSSDDGEHKFTDLIKFKKSYDYKVVITDDNENITANKVFYVDSSSRSSSNSDVDEFTITLADSTPSEDDEVKLTLKAVDSDNDTVTDYDGTNAEISVEYRTSSSSSWKDATSSYVAIDDETPTFSNGSASTYITFKSDYDYRITVTDNDDEDIYTQKTIYVDGGSSSSASNGDVDEFTITLADSTPSEDDEVKLTLKAVDSDNDTVTDYDGANAEISVEYRTSSSSSWKDATSSYVAIDDETPTFSNGSAYTYITFKSDYDYRITVTDNDDDDIYTQKTIYVDGGSSSSASNGDVDEFTITLADSTPSEDDEVKLTLKAVDSDNDTVTDYDGANAEISVEYRTSSSSSWKDATSSYVAIDDETPTFSNGSASTYITFKSDYDYRITVTDNDDDDIYTQKIIYIDGGSSSSSSSVDGFTSSELDTIEDIYDSWDDLIAKLKSSSSSLRYNSTRQTMSNNLKTEMKNILNDSSNRLYDDYDEFNAAYKSWVSYTTRNQ